MRWILNLFCLLFALAVFVSAMLFVMGNPVPVTLDLFWSDWRPQVPAGQLLVGFLLVGLLLGFMVGLMLAGVWRLSRGRSRSS